MNKWNDNMINKSGGRIAAGLIVLLVWALSLTYSHEIFSRSQDNQKVMHCKTCCCKNQNQKNKHLQSRYIDNISARHLKRLMDRNSNDVIVINVLSRKNYNECHIKRSINIPLSELKDQTRKLNKRKRIVVYCASYKCSASRDAYRILKNLGFKRLNTFEGGMKEWISMKYPVEGACTLEPAEIGGTTL